jgi:hypothetical protein
VQSSQYIRAVRQSFVTSLRRSARRYSDAVGISEVHTVASLVKALCYKPGDFGFETRWRHWNFSALRSRFRNPMRSLDFFFSNLPNRFRCTRPWGLLSLQQKLVPETEKNVSGSTGNGTMHLLSRRLCNGRICVCQCILTAEWLFTICLCLDNVGSSASHNPTRLHGVLRG